MSWIGGAVAVLTLVLFNFLNDIVKELRDIRHHVSRLDERFTELPHQDDY